MYRPVTKYLRHCYTANTPHFSGSRTLTSTLTVDTRAAECLLICYETPSLACSKYDSRNTKTLIKLSEKCSSKLSAAFRLSAYSRKKSETIEAMLETLT